MSLLSHQTRDVKEDAAPGESYTRGSSHLIIAGIVAAVVVTIVMAIYVISGEKPPAAIGEIVDVWAHPMHTETSGFDANGAPMPKESFDQVLVFTHVRLHNQSKQPIFLHQILTNINTASGVDSSYAASTVDYERVFQAYPTLDQWHAAAISPSTTINPGQTVEGTFVSSFRMPKADWEAQKGLDFTFGFQYLPDLKLTPHGQVIER